MTQEASKKELELHEDDPTAVRTMLRFLYGVKYDFDMPDDWNDIISHARVYVIAEKYCLHQLKKMAAEAMKSLLHQLKIGNERVESSLINILDIIWTGTTSDDDLARPLLANHCASKLKTILKSNEFCDLLNRHGELGKDMLVPVAIRNES